LNSLNYFLFLLISRIIEKINNNAGNTPRNNTFSLNNPAPVNRIRISSEGGRELPPETPRFAIYKLGKYPPRLVHKEPVKEIGRCT
jgi:hypothetical protein